MISTAPPRVASRSTPLERMRLQRGWTRKDLSARSGVCTRTISRIERAGVRPHRATLRVLAEAFGVEIADLFPVNDEAPDTASGASHKAVSASRVPGYTGIRR